MLALSDWVESTVVANHALARSEFEVQTSSGSVLQDTTLIASWRKRREPHETRTRTEDSPQSESTMVLLVWLLVLDTEC